MCQIWILYGDDGLANREAFRWRFQKRTGESRRRASYSTTMSLPDTDTVPHHCKIAGRADTLFSDDAIALIHNASRGRDDCHIRPVREVFKIGFLGDLDYGDGLVVRCQLLNDPRSGRQTRPGPQPAAASRCWVPGDTTTAHARPQLHSPPRLSGPMCCRHRGREGQRQH